LLRLAAVSLTVALGLAAVSTHAAPARGGLPRLASTALPAPEPPVTTELEQALSQLASAKAEDRAKGAERLKDGGASLLPAMAKKLQELRKGMNRDLAAILVTEARKGRAKKDEGEENGAKKKKPKHDDDKDKQAKDDPGNDWLALVTAKPKPADPVYKDLVAVLAIERALVDLGTTPAARELVNVYFYFGDLLRIDVQQMIGRLGDKAVPALMEARKHDVEKVRRWASRQLDVLGRAIPGEAVQINDPDVVADVLRAYGRTKEIDALRVVVSFTSSDRVHVREAAREALVSYGEAALWQLREAYESTTGKRPPPGQTWDKLATDLFEAHDRARLEEIFGTFEEGLAKQKEGKLEEMAALFDVVLARAPSFERRAEMADGYIALARKVDNDDPGKALLLARKGLRLDPAGAQSKPVESYILTLEGEELSSHGLADTTLFKRALEIDPANQRAKNDLARLESNPRARAASSYRYLAAAAIGVIATIATLFVGLFRRAVPPPEPRPDEG
jgi:hypothetical protein